jgi:tetratricopeptide (TPR) repeat protein
MVLPPLFLPCLPVSRLLRGRATAMVLGLGLVLAAGSAQADDYADVSRLIRAGQYPEAQAKADQYLAGKPRDPQMRFLKGVIQSESGKPAEAITTFTQITQDYPELPEPYNNLAVLYAGQSQFDKARASLEMAIRTNPSYATAHENLGDVYARLASQAYSKALQLDGANAGVQPKLALIRTLFTAEQKGAAASAAAANSAANTPVKPAVPLAVAPAAPTLPAAVTPAVVAKAPVPAPAVVAKAPVVTAPPAKPAAPIVAPAAVATAVTPAVVAAAQVAKPAPAAIATATPAPAPAAASNDSASSKDVEAAVRGWATAWAAKDMAAYLGSYSPNFDTPGKQSRKAWEQDRRERIVGKSRIDVKLSNLDIAMQGSKATARFKQDYNADSLNVSSRKTLNLVKSGERWVIVKETSGG